jgi:TolB-like protein/Tfp pilus assembly protein PilF
VAGTLQFMAPEQLRGEAADARTDIYAVGVILYEMATGQHPFPARVAPALVDAILHQQPAGPAALRPNLSLRVQEIILKCLEKEAQHRYQSCADLLADFHRAAVHADRDHSLAVLYFENLGGEAGDEYFRDGITEDITTELSKIRDLKVFSRSAVLAYRDRPVTPAHVGQELRASHVLEGSIRRGGERVRITAKLVETATGHALWAERYDRELRDIFAIQDEIAHAIARALRLVLSEGERRAIEKVPTADVEAYDLYLRGRQFFHQFRRKGFDFARQMFSRAIERDPGYARAYAGIADCCAFLHSYWESRPALIEEADRASARALELDPDLAEAHASRGLTASLKKDYETARREFETAMRLDPTLFEPCYFYARSYYAQGDLERAAHWFAEASRVYPEDYQAPMLMASALHGLGRAEEATSAYRRGLDAAERHLLLYPGDSRALYFFGANALSQLGDRERSLEWAARALAVEPDEPQVLYNVACVYALLNESDRAIDCLERCITGGWGQREWMEHDPDLASLRGNPRFQALLKPAPSAAGG